jgi:DNA-binding transcriptional MerR regulator
MSQKPFYRSHEVAKLFGISCDTIRYYERMGLISTKRSSNRYREYSKQTIDRIRLIRAAISIGFSTKELKPILNNRDQGGIPCRDVRQLLMTKLQNLQIQIRQMRKMQIELIRLLKDWDQRLEKHPDRPARLLESFATNRPL